MLPTTAMPGASPLLGPQPVQPGEEAAFGPSGEPGAQDPERDLGVDYAIEMDPEERRLLGKHIQEEIDRYIEGTQQRRDNCRQWRADFEMMPVGASPRWEGGAEITSPLTQIYCQSHATRLNTQIVYADPPFGVVAREASSVDVTTIVEEVLTAVLEESNWGEIASQIHTELPITGNVFLRVTYDEKYVRQPKVRYEIDEDLFDTLIDAGVPMYDAWLDSMVRGADGRPKLSLEWTPTLKYAGPCMKVIPWEDGVVLPLTARDPDEARGIGERLVISGGELISGARRGKYIQEAVDEIIGRSSDRVPDDRTERLGEQGVTADPDTEPADGQARYREFLCYELCWRGDFNDDDEDEWAIVTLHYDTGTILRLQYLPLEHGEPYYHLFRYFIRTAELWGMGVAEKIAVLQDADTAVLCQLIDSADLACNVRGNIVYDSTSGFIPDQVVYQLNRPIKVDSVEGFKQLDVPALAPEHYQLHQLIKDACDLVTATSNPSLGKATDQDKTLGEVQLVSAASNMIFEELAGRVARQWARVWDHIRWLMAQYGQGGMVRYRKSADPGQVLQIDGGQEIPVATIGGQQVPAPGGYAFGKIPSHLLTAAVDLVPAGLNQLADATTRLNLAMMVQNMLASHMLTGQDLEIQKTALKETLTAARYPHREKVMELIERALMMAQAAAAQQAAAADAAAVVAGAAEGEAQGGADAAAANSQRLADQGQEIQNSQAAAPPPPAGPSVAESP